MGFVEGEVDRMSSSKSLGYSVRFRLCGLRYHTRRGRALPGSLVFSNCGRGPCSLIPAHQSHGVILGTPSTPPSPCLRLHMIQQASPDIITCEVRTGESDIPARVKECGASKNSCRVSSHNKPTFATND